MFWEVEKGGGVVKDEEEMAEAGDVEKEKKVMHKYSALFVFSAEANIIKA